MGLEDKCKPNYGSCEDGRRSVPIELLDVAGLVPGAHMGKGLGNRFLDDLRHADALVHVVDVSGTTDAEGMGGRAGKVSWNGTDTLQERRQEVTIPVRTLYGYAPRSYGGYKAT